MLRLLEDPVAVLHAESAHLSMMYQAILRSVQQIRACSAALQPSCMERYTARSLASLTGAHMWPQASLRNSDSSRNASWPAWAIPHSRMSYRIGPENLFLCARVQCTAVGHAVSLLSIFPCGCIGCSCSCAHAQRTDSAMSKTSYSSLGFTVWLLRVYATA